jgi:hypothetical protein
VTWDIAFGVGVGKSGTHSLASMFDDTIKAVHEPDSERFLALVLQSERGRLPIAELQYAVRELILAQRAQLFVASIAGYLIRPVFNAFPDAGYILTIRDPRSWLWSVINQQLTRRPLPGSGWHAFFDLCLVRDFRVERKEDAPLIKCGLAGLDAYLGSWAKHNLTVLDTVPYQQLCIVATTHLGRDSERLARFIGVPPSSAQRQRSHQYQGDYSRSSPLDELPPDYLADRVSAYTDRLLELSERLLPIEQQEQLVEGIAGHSYVHDR